MPMESHATCMMTHVTDEVHEETMHLAGHRGPRPEI